MKARMTNTGSIEITAETESEAGSLRNFERLFLYFLECEGFHTNTGLKQYLNINYINLDETDELS